MSTPKPVQRLSTFIRERKATILNDWEGSVRMLPVARKLTRLALFDHIPDLLGHIADMAEELAAGKSPTLPKQQAEEHALDRLDEGFDLREVVAEYGTLRECVARLWEGESSAPGGLAELRLLNDAIDRAVAESVTHYVDARDRALQALDHVAAAAFESNDLDDFLRRILDVLVKTTPAVNTAVMLLREGQRFRIRAAVGLEQEASVGTSIAWNQGLAGRVAAERKPVLISAPADSLVHDAVLGKCGVRVLYGIPLVDHESIIGVAIMGSLSAFEFSKECKRLFSTMVNRATAAIFQHMLREAADRRARQQEAIAKLGIAAIEIGDAEQLVNRAVEMVSQALATEMTGVFEVLPDGSALVLRAGVGWNEGAVGRAQVGAGRNSQSGYTLDTAEPVIVEDLRSESRFFPPALLREHGVVSGMSVIVYARGHGSHPYGVLGAFSRSRLSFSSEDVSFLQAVANFVAEAVERHRAEQSLRRSEARYRSLVTATSAAVWTTNADGLTEEPSTSWQALTGQLHQQYVGWGWLEMVHPDHRERARETWIRAHAHQCTYESEYMLRASNGEYRWTHVRAVPVIDIDGTVREWVGMNVDIMDRKCAEEQVQQALEQAQQAVRTRETVLALVSHDLRNPLNVISMNATSLMKFLQADTRAHKRIELIQRSVTRMACLIEDLLDMASIQAGKLSLAQDENAVGALVAEAVDSDEPLAAEHALELKTVLNVPTSMRVRCDRGRMLQVFSNLLGNALKFSPPGSAITITADVAGPEVLFAITDQGPGIAPEQLPHIFEPFWTMQRSAQKGTGLGLYIAKAIVDAHGGRLWVESKVGVGTTFYFTLPQEGSAK